VSGRRRAGPMPPPSPARHSHSPRPQEPPPLPGPADPTRRHRPAHRRAAAPARDPLRRRWARRGRGDLAV